MKRVIVSSICFLFLFSSCKDLGTGLLIDKDSNKYPTQLNNTWTYTSEVILEHYDSLGNISHIENIPVPNTTVKITSVSDVMGNYTNLIKFEYYDSNNTPSITWYKNDEETFSAIAYSNAGTSRTVIPKNNKQKKYLSFTEFKEICRIIKYNLPIQFSMAADSILYYEHPRIVLSYPLEVGKNWDELITPFYRKRIVKELIDFDLNGKRYKVFVIEGDLIEYKIKMIDYISLEKGLLKREIIADSIAITNPSLENLGFVKSTENSYLIEMNF